MNGVEGVSIEELVVNFGSPLFVFSAQSLKKNVRGFREEFAQKYKRVEVAYSYKVNRLLGVLGVIHEEGAWAEVASGFEYELARKLGVPGVKIVFNGPYKKREELIRAVEEEALVNVDHICELTMFEDIALSLQKTLDVGIRVNMNVGIRQAADRFGFNIESGQAWEVSQRCAERKLLRIVAIHTHLTSYIIEPGGLTNDSPAKDIRIIWPKSSDMYRKAAWKVARFAYKLREQFGFAVKYLDMGGGFPGIDSLDSYMKAVTEPILGTFDERDLPVLILEPGRAIVRDAGYLIATVVGVKDFPEGDRGVIVDAGVNFLPTSFWKLQEIESSSELRAGLKTTMVYGPLCLQTDILGKAKLPELNAGDNVIFKNVGAYNFSQSSSFIFPRPAVILIEGGVPRVIRKAERLDDIFKFEKLE